MIKTEAWTIADLTKYLVSVRSSLNEEEWERLKATAAFPTEAKPGEKQEKQRRYRANQLYEPSDALRSLGLPIIDWGQNTKWRSTSEDGKMKSSHRRCCCC